MQTLPYAVDTSSSHGSALNRKIEIIRHRPPALLLRKERVI